MDIIGSIILALLTVVATSLDEVILLAMFYGTVPADPYGTDRRRAIGRGYIVGSILAIMISATVSLGLVQIPDHSLLSWIGLIPIIMGVYSLIRPKGQKDELEVAGTVAEHTSGLAPTLQFVILALVLSVDDFGVYIPLLTSMVLGEALIMIITAIICVFIIAMIGRRISDISSVKRILDKVERWLVPVLFIAIGAYTVLDGQIGL
ncbi:MAG: cadmium resistance transporter [Methanomassiliicoccaceae archaeon]|nr:cadmium resistance transporter [Methanomassiliicoccaceae archaeon]